MDKHFIAWWNVENLHDVEQSINRPEWLAKKLKAEVKGWTPPILDRKISQLSSVISRMNNQAGPDILGICEVENARVVDLLTIALSQSTGRNYRFVHHDTHDQRGVDQAFIYDADKYSVDPDHIYSYEVVKRYGTRDILQITIKTKQNHELILIANHWPSRLPGQFATEPYRIIAAETLSYWLSRIQEIKGSDVPILVMGDFNDEPFNRSLTDYALSSRSRKKVNYARNPMLFNLMWPLLGQKGSYVNQGIVMLLDQMMVSKGIAKRNQTFRIQPDSIDVIKFEGMVHGRYQTPVRFGLPSKASTYNSDGYSDHLPIQLILKEY